MIILGVEVNMFYLAAVVTSVIYFVVHFANKRKTECPKCHKQTTKGDLEICSSEDCEIDTCSDCGVSCEGCDNHYCSDAHFDKHECESEEESEEDIVYSKRKDWAYFDSDVDTEEISANIDKLEKEGFKISFIDGNGYIHMRKGGN